LRLASATLVVPIFEELFLRSFLVRYLETTRTEHGDFRRIPLGQLSLRSVAGAVIAMAVTHDRWIRGGLYSALMLAVLHRERRMDGILWAHAVTNLLLGVHVITTETWGFW
jgi:CAAX prenyl protease-like protein